MPPKALSLKPIPTAEVPLSYVREAEDTVSRYVADKVFDGIFKVIRKYFPKEKLRLENSSKRLIDKLRSGAIVYRYNIFRGDIDEATAQELRRLGAKYRRTVRGYVLEASELPKDLQDAVAYYAKRFEDMRREIMDEIESIDPDLISSTIPNDRVIRPVLEKGQSQLEKSLATIRVEPDLSPAMVETIKEEWSENTKRYIKDFLSDEVESLRQMVGENAWEGKRHSEVVSELISEFGVTKRRAEFIARQETHLAMTALKKAGLQRANLPYYRWECVVGSPKHPVRPMHKALEGQVFSWDDPPITAPNGDRNHPGQDYNCRCVARPLFGFESDYPE